MSRKSQSQFGTIRLDLGPEFRWGVVIPSVKDEIDIVLADSGWVDGVTATYFGTDPYTEEGGVKKRPVLRIADPDGPLDPYSVVYRCAESRSSGGTINLPGYLSGLLDNVAVMTRGRLGETPRMAPPAFRRYMWGWSLGPDRPPELSLLILPKTAIAGLRYAKPGEPHRLYWEGGAKCFSSRHLGDVEFGLSLPADTPPVSDALAPIDPETTKAVMRKVFPFYVPLFEFLWTAHKV